MPKSSLAAAKGPAAAKAAAIPLAGTQRSLQIEYAIRDVVLPAREIEAQGHKVLKLNVGDPNAYGFAPPPHMVEALHEAAKANMNGYTASEGDPQLIEAIVKRERRRNKVDYAPADVLVTNGSGEGIQMLLGSSVNPGDEVLIPGPSYPPYDSLVKFFGGVPVHYRTIEGEDWQPDVDDLRRKITPRSKAVCLINPNNPTGALYSQKVVKQFTDVVGEHAGQLFMVSDEIYDEMTFDGTQVASKTVAPDVPMVTLNGFSKVYLVPGWRLGHMLWNDPTGSLAEIRTGVGKQSRVRLCASSIGQRAAIAALEGPQDHIAKTNAALKRRRDFAVKRLNSIEGVSSAKPDGAFYAFPRIDALSTPKGRKAWANDKEFVLDFLRTEKVLTVHGSGFGPEYGAGHIRLVILPDVPVLETAFDRLEGFLARKLKGAA
ncbi:MAG TPA: aminotransferase class I/II-fold pyridoxal phosphate-dependent enzyme [Candidatus Thermoplasmatota archaeon]|nr:aminotransferase class I/II-fold pyridoxal phosphate-dependent enzyme [Candidatus Thermoplasmatota archaeon]